MTLMAAPTLDIFSHMEKDTIPGIYGYAESREVAMAAFAKSWRHE